MLENIKPTRILFLDTETAACAPDYAHLDPVLKHLWEEKVSYRLKEAETPANYFSQEAGLHAEFGRIVCVSIGKIIMQDAKQAFEIRTYDGVDTQAPDTISSNNEKRLLTDLADCLNKLPGDVQIAAYNGLGFDVGYICRRMIINGIKPPAKIDLSDKKPWDAQIIDPMALWRFGQNKHYCTLELMAYLLGIPTPKDELRGKDVSATYWAGELAKISRYCERDIVALASIVLKLKGLEIIRADDVVIKQN